MTKITESQIEQYTIEPLEKQGYQCIHIPDITLDKEIFPQQYYKCIRAIKHD